MGSDSDDIVSLPSPPPSRPAARREAIDAALRKFDGIEEPAAHSTRQRPRGIAWASLNRRPAGALVAAAIIAVVSIPAIQIALRDRPPEVAEEAAESAPEAVQTIRAGPGSRQPARHRPRDPASPGGRGGRRRGRAFADPAHGAPVRHG